jgi:flagellar protein FliL
MSDAPAEETATPPAKAGGSKLLPILLIVNTLLIGGVAFLVLKKPAAPAVAAPGHEAPAAAAAGDGKGAPAAPGVWVKLENFVIQLRSLEAERYLRIAFDIEVGSEMDKQAVLERIPYIRDAIIGYFSDRTMEELRGSEAMERTKKTIVEKLDGIVPGRRIRGIYITDFIIQ